MDIDEELKQLSNKECERNIRQLNKNSVKNAQIWEKVKNGDFKQRSGVHVSFDLINIYSNFYIVKLSIL